MQMFKVLSSATRISTLTVVYSYHKEKHCRRDALDNFQILSLAKKMQLSMLTMVKMTSYRDMPVLLAPLCAFLCKEYSNKITQPTKGTSAQTCS